MAETDCCIYCGGDVEEEGYGACSHCRENMQPDPEPNQGKARVITDMRGARCASCEQLRKTIIKIERGKFKAILCQKCCSDIYDAIGAVQFL